MITQNGTLAIGYQPIGKRLRRISYLSPPQVYMKRRNSNPIMTRTKEERRQRETRMSDEEG